MSDLTILIDCIRFDGHALSQEVDDSIMPPVSSNVGVGRVSANVLVDQVGVSTHLVAVLDCFPQKLISSVLWILLTRFS